MYVKKPSNIALEDKKFVFILIGFILALSLIYISFEWTKQIVVYEIEESGVIIEPDIEIPATQETPPPPPPPPPPKTVIEEIVIQEDDVEVAKVEIETADDDKKEEIQMNIPEPAKVDDYDDEVIFQVVEKMPEFPGGQAALFKYLSNSIRYPVIAQENGIQGRVICQFVVNRDGSIVDVVVMRGQDPSLDKEAVRVIKAMPKWTPGQQRGKAVRVKYTLPVNFKLQ